MIKDRSRSIETASRLARPAKSDFGQLHFAFQKRFCLFPFRVLLLPFSSLGIFHNSGVELKHDAVHMNWRQKLKRFGKQILWAPYRSFAATFGLISQPGENRLSRLLFLLPAMLMMALFTFVIIQVFSRGKVIVQRYQKGAQAALQKRDFPLAKTYFTRLMSDRELSPRQKLAWVDILAKTGDSLQAEEKLNELAPFERAGFAPAHELQAILLAKSIGKSEDPDLLPKLHWHLKNSVSNTPELNEAWARYYLACEDYENAIVALNKAALENPGFYLMLARLHQVRGENTKQAKGTSSCPKILYRFVRCRSI